MAKHKDTPIDCDTLRKVGTFVQMSGSELAILATVIHYAAENLDDFYEWLEGEYCDDCENELVGLDDKLSLSVREIIKQLEAGHRSGVSIVNLKRRRRR